MEKINISKNSQKTHENTKKSISQNPTSFGSFFKKYKTVVLTAFGLLFILIGLGTYSYFINNQKRDNALNNLFDQNNNSRPIEEYYFLDPNIPSKLSSSIEAEFEKLNSNSQPDSQNTTTYKQTESASKATIKIQTDFYQNLPSLDEMNFKSHFYQIWSVSKPWDQLGTSSPSTVTLYSHKIALENNTKAKTTLSKFFELDPNIKSADLHKYNQNDSNSFSKLYLQTLQETDSTRITIPINGQTIFAKKTWEDTSYPLIMVISFSAKHEKTYNLLKTRLFNSPSKTQKYLTDNNFTTELPTSNDFTSILKTGTSVTGGPGWDLCTRQKGLNHPIQKVKDQLLKADITIISNETSFVENCQQNSGTTAFCGKPSFIQNLLTTDIDIISLTGNHMADYGRDRFTQTLNLYEKNMMKYYGAGHNIDEAWEPLIIDIKDIHAASTTHNKANNANTDKEITDSKDKTANEETANREKAINEEQTNDQSEQTMQNSKIAFIGYNKMGPPKVLADKNQTGTAYYDREQFKTSMEQAKKQADLIWVDTHLWPEYGTSPSGEQINLSQEAINFGADIVTGVSSHEIQSMTFYKNKPIFYGLGNFWFDQLLAENTRKSLAIKVYVYQNDIRNIEILPTYMLDACQVEFQSKQEKTNTLQYLRDISKFK